MNLPRNTHPKERIDFLCRRIQEEKDPEAFTQLVCELNDLLQGKVSANFYAPDVSLGAVSQERQSNPYLLMKGSTILPHLLEATIAATAADFGTVQLFDSSCGGLKIVAQRGFQRDFLGYFETVVSDDDCACGAAMKNAARIVVADVTTDPIFSR